MYEQLTCWRIQSTHEAFWSLFTKSLWEGGRDNDKHSNVLSLQPTRRNGSLYAKLSLYTQIYSLYLYNTVDFFNQLTFAWNLISPTDMSILYLYVVLHFYTVTIIF